MDVRSGAVVLLRGPLLAWRFQSLDVRGDGMMRRVLMVPHDPRWAALYEQEAVLIAEALGDNLVVSHHIGSTSIPLIHAKPCIDMLIEVVDIEEVDRQAGAMEALGYVGMGEFGLPGRRFFRKDDAQGDRTHHAHIYGTDSPNWRRHLALRDFMRAHPDLAQEYSNLKQRLAAAHPEDIEAYMDGKDGFIKEMEQRALAWVGQK